MVFLVVGVKVYHHHLVFLFLHFFVHFNSFLLVYVVDVEDQVAYGVLGFHFLLQKLYFERSEFGVVDGFGEVEYVLFKNIVDGAFIAPVEGEGLPVHGVFAFGEFFGFDGVEEAGAFELEGGGLFAQNGGGLLGGAVGGDHFFHSFDSF